MSYNFDCSLYVIEKFYADTPHRPAKSLFIDLKLAAVFIAVFTSTLLSQVSFSIYCCTTVSGTFQYLLLHYCLR